MKKKIKDLKKGDKFRFNDNIYIVSQKYSEWKKNDDPYLKSTDGQLWYNEDLDVDAISEMMKTNRVFVNNKEVH